MNYLNEKYPKNKESFKVLISRGNSISESLLNQLISPNTPTLNDIFKKRKNVNRQLDITIQRIDNKLTISWSEVSKKPYSEIVGIYALGEKKRNKTEPVYVGISRGVFRRLKQHSWGKKSNEATLANLIAKNSLSNEERKMLKQSKSQKKIVKERLAFLRKIEQEKIRNFKVAIFPIKPEKNFELAFFELVVAGLLKTKYNTFRTH